MYPTDIWLGPDDSSNIVRGTESDPFPPFWRALMIAAGFASVDITPALGTAMPGGFSPRPSTGILDPLGVHACVVAGAEPIACVGVDAVSVPDPVAREAKQAIASRCPLAPEAVLIAASHTHCGGPANSVLGTDADPAYQARIAQAIADAVCTAWECRVPATLTVGKAPCPGWAFNRRWTMRNGGEATNPGKSNPDAIRPAGPVDDELGIVACHDQAGTLLGYIGSFTCHSTVIWGTQFSGDYSAYWRDALGAPLVFLNGACGDINQINFASPDTKESGPAHAKAMAQALAAASRAALAKATPLSEAQVGHRHREVTLGLRVPSAEQEAEDRALVTVPENEWGSPHWQARDRLLLLADLAGAKSLVCEVSTYHLGPAVIPAAPWQPFCEFGLRLKQGIDTEFVFPASFANGSIGYVPTPQAFAGGGYEPTLCRGSKLIPETGDTIVAALLALANQS